MKLYIKEFCKGSQQINLHLYVTDNKWYIKYKNCYFKEIKNQSYLNFPYIQWMEKPKFCPYYNNESAAREVKLTLIEYIKNNNMPNYLVLEVKNSPFTALTLI